MSETKSKTHPLIVTAAVAVTLFSLVGVGVMTGFIPNSLSSDNLKRETEAKAAQAAAAKTAAPAARVHTPKPGDSNCGKRACAAASPGAARCRRAHLQRVRCNRLGESGGPQG
jgi:hypothetical protein